MFKGVFRHLHAGFPLEGGGELGYANYFTYVRWNRRPIVFEVLSHREGMNLTSAEYEAFLQRSWALQAKGFFVVRITDIELEYARKHVYERVSYAVRQTEWLRVRWDRAV